MGIAKLVGVPADARKTLLSARRADRNPALHFTRNAQREPLTHAPTPTRLTILSTKCCLSRPPLTAGTARALRHSLAAPPPGRRRAKLTFLRWGALGSRACQGPASVLPRPKRIEALDELLRVDWYTRSRRLPPRRRAAARPKAIGAASAAPATARAGLRAGQALALAARAACDRARAGRCAAVLAYSHFGIHATLPRLFPEDVTPFKSFR